MCEVLDLETKLLGHPQAVLILITMESIHRSQSVLFCRFPAFLMHPRKVFVMSRLDEYFESIAKTNGAEGPLTFLAPKLVAPGVLPATDAFNAQSQGGMRRWIVDGRTAYDVDEALSPDPVELAGDIMYQSFRAVTLHEDLFDFFMCALYVGIHKNGIMLNSVEDPNKGQAVSWQDEQLAKRNRGERAISLLNFRSKYCIAVWSVHSHVESRRIYFVTLASELEYEYSNNFPVEEFVEQRQMSRKPSERSSDKRLAFSETVVAVRLKMQEAEEETTTESAETPVASQDPAKKAEEFSKAVEDQAVVQTAMKEIKEWLRRDAANPPIEEPTSEQDAVPKGEQMTPKPSESSKEPRNYLAEMDERLTEAIEGSGTTVTNLGPRRIQGSLFVFPGQKVRKEAVPPASDVVASASDEEVQMTKKSSESSKEPESSPEPPPKEPTNSWPEALEAFNKELRDSGTTVTEVGGLPITGSQFIFPGRKARRPAAPPASDVVAPASDEEV